MDSRIQVTSKEEVNGVLRFTVENMNVSMINAIRRTIISNIPCYVFRSSPYSKSTIQILKNTTKLNNEIISHRLSCVPIHKNAYHRSGIQGESDPFLNTVVIISASNNSSDIKNSTIKYVTTADFEVYTENEQGKLEPVSKEEASMIFPRNPLTGDGVLVSRLMPRLSSDIPGEELSIRAGIVKTTAREDSCYTMASTCSYGMSEDIARQKEVWKEMEAKLSSQGMNKDEIEMERRNWLLLDGKRIYRKDAFDFILETVGVYSNDELIDIACRQLINEFNRIRNLATSDGLRIQQSQTTMKAYDIIIENDDYTIGKVLEYFIHDTYYRREQIIQYVGFRKKHPHDSYAILRVSFTDDNETVDKINEIMKDASNMAIDSFIRVIQQVTGAMYSGENVEDDTSNDTDK